MSSELIKKVSKLFPTASNRGIIKKAIAGDKNGDEHYNLLSTFNQFEVQASMLKAWPI